MANELLHYNVFDTIEDKYVLRDVSGSVVSSTIGIPKNKISSYVREKYLYKRRYSITKQRINDPEHETVSDIRLTPKDIKLMAEWDKWRMILNPNAKVGAVK